MLPKYDQLKYVVCFALVSLSSLFSQNSKSYFDCPCPQIIAHQGSSLELPPNTIEAFELAINQGADIIELDIWQTKDCLLYTSPSPRDGLLSRMPSSA